MKRFILALAILLTTMPGLMAQRRSGFGFDRDVDFSIGSGPITFQSISYVGWGVHLPANVMAEEQRHALNSEFFLNIIELRARIYEYGHITLGVDWDRDCYRLDKEYYWQPGVNNQSVSIARRGSERIRKTNLVVHTFSIPLGFEQRIGSCVLRLDGALDINMAAKTRVKTEGPSGEKNLTVTKGIPTRTMTCHITAAVSFGGLGFYARYNPLPQFEAGVGPQYRPFTLGLVLGLGM